MSTRAPISPNGATATTQALPRGQAAELSRTARAGLRRAARWATDQDMAVSIGSGQLIRPLVAMAPLRDVQAPPRHFWDAVLAVQLAHEASLVHDDIVDGAVTRRGEPTVVSREGVPGALVHGDHLLTSAYRCAARTGSVAFTELFTRAVERTVAAERAQGRGIGTVLDWDTYERIAMGKAGELLGCALAVAPVLEGRRDAAAHFELGRVLGIVYQMFDDLLDYCPRTDTGKPCLGDYGGRRWTWVMAEAPELGFGLPTPRVMRALHTTVDGTSPMGRALGRFTRAADGLRLSIRSRLPDDRTIEPLLTAWTHRARQAVIREAIAVNRQGSSNGEKHPRTTAATAATTATAATRATRNQPGSQDPDAALRALRSIVPEPWAVQSYLGQHSRSFRFSLGLFPPDDRARIARVYAYCRVTDNLVDGPTAGTGAAAMLDAWMDLSRRAYDGETTPFPVLDTVMTEMARAEVPFAHAEALADGMRMDLRGQRYETLSDLRLYTYRVAGVVGLWLTGLHGVRDQDILERAERLGHAMQLTNIIRDVAEDWDRGRLYIPADLMNRHGVTASALARLCAGHPVTRAYRGLVAELIDIAEADYSAALAAVPLLPRSFARPVAVAAHVYRGIHNGIRRRRYDNLRTRSYTSAVAKGYHATRALWELYTRRADHTITGSRVALVASGDDGPA